MYAYTHIYIYIIICISLTYICIYVRIYTHIYIYIYIYDICIYINDNVGTIYKSDINQSEPTDSPHLPTPHTSKTRIVHTPMGSLGGNDNVILEYVTVSKWGVLHEQ